MKKQIMAVTLTAAMLAGLAAVPVWADDAGSDEGKVLNIYCWNEEFKTRLTDHYPGYEEVDGTHGKIGDVDVVWNITPSDDNAYQNNLDETLLKQADAAATEEISPKKYSEQTIRQRFRRKLLTGIPSKQLPQN